MNEATEKTTAKRCAIYTRKSTDEGLDKDYNSLEDQEKKSNGVVPNGVKEQMKVAALLVGAIRTAIMIDDLGEITPEEIGLVTEALRKELDDLRHVAGLVR